MLTLENSILLVVDIQEKLLPAMYNQKEIEENTARMIRIADIISLPVVITEQYPRGLGPTVKGIMSAFENNDVPIIEKTSFGALREERVIRVLSGKKSVLLCGIESHVCVCQTGQELLEKGWEVHVLSDCAGSRKESNHQLGLRRLERAGAVVTGVEMAAFELMKTSKHPGFRQVSSLIK